MSEPLVDVRGVWRRYKLPRARPFSRRPELVAVREVTFEMFAGEILGIVGESGSGKSTLSRLIVGLELPDEGSISIAGRRTDTSSRTEREQLHRDVQIVFQDPLSSFDPRMTIRRALHEPLRALGVSGSHEQRVSEVLDALRLPQGAGNKYPHEFSGGQLQRVAIARALAPRPSLLVADEPVSSLDLSVQGQILNHILELRDEFNLTVVLVTHDLAVAHHTTDRVVVMNAGRVFESGPSESLFTDPRHPYTEGLLESILTIGGDLPLGSPSQRNLATGSASCSFAQRCPYVHDRCLTEEPTLLPVDPTKSSHLVACHLRNESRKSVKASHTILE